MDSTNPLINHNSIKTDVVTDKGAGVKVTPITHHLNKWMDSNTINKYILEPFKNKQGDVRCPPKPGKTSTLSNGSFFIPNENIESNDPDKRIEFRSKNGLLNRVEEDNFKNHFNHHLKTSNTFTHILEETPVTDLDKDVNDQVVLVEKD